MTTVAIIGGGLAGICSARACLQHNLDVTIFESRPVLGGLWSKHDTPVFENLTTNTAVYETVLSDIPPKRVTPSKHLKEDSLCYTRDEMFDYAQHAANSTPGLIESARLSTKVVNLKRCDGKFQVSFSAITTGGDIQTEVFDRVIVACGLFATPVFPKKEELPGVDTYAHKIMHVREYQNPTHMKDQRVLVVGGSISGCEAAGDMAEAPEGTGAKSVTMSTRTMRYLISKQVAERLIVSVTSTRYHFLRNLAGRYTDKENNEDLLKEVERMNMRNSDFNAPEPSGPIKRPFMPGYVPVNHKFLTASKKGRVEWKIGGLKRLTESGAEFLDGSVGEYDKIVFATGYTHDLSFMEKELSEKVTNPGKNLLKLYDFTFHPEIEHLAFVGVYPPGSATTPILDCQSRWVARVFAGELKPVSAEAMWEGIKADAQWRQSPDSHYLVFGYEGMDLFARHGGFEVNLGAYPEIAKGLIFSPMVPAQFRMFGNGKLESGRDECYRQLQASGFKIGDRKIGEEEMAELREVLKVLENREDCPKGLREAVECLTCE